MKRHLILAISVLALTAVSQRLFAAEAETPAPRERAAPAERERAPARERQARPAPQRAAPQQAAQSPSSGWTGSQVGGFGGGNVGGGGFADPICLNTVGLNNGCTPAQFTHSLAKTSGVGGAVAEYKWALNPWVVFGVLADVSFGSVSASGSQTNKYASDPLIAGQLTQETYTNSVRQGTSGSARFKIGVVPTWNSGILFYGTAGAIISRLDGNFTYTASNFNPSSSCVAFAACATNVASVVNWSQTRPGFVGGGGVEFKTPWFGPAFIVTLDYSYATFGSFNEQLPIAVATQPPAGGPCVQAPTRNCTVLDTAHINNLSSQKFTLGAKLAFW
jgi:hypothetical protein